jgi:hypothetical protein
MQASRQESQQSAGKKITAEEADKYLKKYIETRESLQKHALSALQAATLQAETKQSAINHFSSDINAFIFSKELITRFFSGVDEHGNPTPQADYLMVVKGANIEDDPATPKTNELGIPTIVVAGVNKHPTEPNKFVSLSIPYAADQHPPTQTIVEFPDTGVSPVLFSVTI